MFNPVSSLPFIALANTFFAILPISFETQILLPINSNLLVIYSSKEKRLEKLVDDTIIPSTASLLSTIFLNLDLIHNTSTFLSRRPVGRKTMNIFTVLLIMFYDTLEEILSASRILKSIALTKTTPFIHGNEDKIIILARRNYSEESETVPLSFRNWQSFLNRFKYKQVITCLAKYECLFKYTNQSTEDNNWPDKESNLEGASLRISFSNQVKSKISFIKIQQGSTTKWVEHDGLCIYHLRYLMNKMNFTYTVVWTPGGTGFQQLDGKFSGSLGDIERNEADFSMPISFSENRFINFGLTASLKDEPVKLFSRVARKLSQSDGAVFPFNAVTWILLLGCTLATIALPWVSGWIVFQKSRKCWQLDKIVENVLATLVGQCPTIPAHVRVLLSQRTVITIWVFCSLVLSCTYISKMVGHLTSETFEILPTTLRQLLGMNVKCGFTVIGFIYEIFSSSKNPVFRKIFTKMEQFQEQFGCIAKVLSSDDLFVCATYDAVAKLYLLRNGYRLENGPITGSTRNLFYGPVNIATSPRSRFLPNFNYATQISVDTGLALRWDEMDLRAKRNAIREAHKNIPTQNDVTKNQTTPGMGNHNDVDEGVKLKHLKGPWYLFGSGLGAATFVAMGEIFLSLIGFCGVHSNMVHSYN